jgi:hypothetical protein
MFGGDELRMIMPNGREKHDEFFEQITWRRISLEEEALAECRSADFL